MSILLLQFQSMGLTNNIDHIDATFFFLPHKQNNRLYYSFAEALKIPTFTRNTNIKLLCILYFIDTLRPSANNI
jgi:hypothetical protein